MRKNQKKTINSPLTEVQEFKSDPNIQERKPDSSSVRMEKFGKTKPLQPKADSEKKKKETEAISSTLMKEQKVRLVPSIQKEDNSPVRVEESERTIEPEDSEFQKKEET